MDAFAIVPGARVGPYEVLDQLGRGGMGVVFRARHIQSGKLYALKTVKAPNPHLLSSIRREIQRLRRLSHPGVVQLRDEGVFHNLPWYTMELFDCGTWEQFNERHHPANRPSQQPLPKPALQELLTRTLSLCDALAYIHGEGVVHRDLKPSNVFWPGRERAVLVDFGLVLSYSRPDRREALQVAPLMAGTVAYMAPEQIQGEPVDARADIFALGCMLYESLTGVLPYPATLNERLKQRETQVRPPSVLAPWIPKGLDELILRMLAPDRKDRIGHAKDITQALTSSLFVDAPQLDIEPTRSRDYLYRSGFVGRDDLLVSLNQQLHKLLAGEGKLLLIEGESGSGKTRLLSELLRSASHIGVFVATGECPPQHAADNGNPVIHIGPLKPLRPLLQSIADRCRQDGAACTERLLGSHLHVLSAIEPALSTLPGADRLPKAAPLPIDAAKHRVLSALSDCMTTLAKERPLLLLLDDLQWADPLTMEFLVHLDNTVIPGAPILICGTFRSEEMTTALRELMQRSSIMRLAMRRLDERAVGQMIADMLAVRQAPIELVSVLQEVSAGNPYFITEYLQTAVSEQILRRDGQQGWMLAKPTSTSWQTKLRELGLPITLQALISRRINQLEGTLRTVVMTASVLGREFDGELLFSICGLSESDGADALNDLLRQQLLDPAGGGRYRFVHDKLHEAAYQSLSAQEKRQLHLAAAQAMEAIQSDHFLGLAQHYTSANEPDKARMYLQRAALPLLRIGAHQAATPLLAQALRFADEPGCVLSTEDRAELHRVYADALFGMGDIEHSAEHAEHALTLHHVSIPKSRFQLVLSLLLQTLEQLYWLMRKPDLTRPSDERSLTVAQAALRLSTCHFADSRKPIPSLVSTLLAANLANRAGHSGPRAIPYATLGYVTAMMKIPLLPQRYFRDAVEDAIARSDTHSQVAVAAYECALYQSRGQWAEVDASARRGIEAAERSGDLLGHEAMVMLLAGKEMIRGQLDSAAIHLEQVCHTAATRNAHRNRGWALSLLALARYWTGQSVQAIELAHSAVSCFETERGNDAANPKALLSALFLSQGQTKQALQLAEESVEILQRRPLFFQMWTGCSLLLDTLLQLLEREPDQTTPSACKLIDQIELVLQMLQLMCKMAPIAHPLQLRASGMLLRISGHPQSAKRLLRRSIRTAQQLQIPLSEAAAHLELAKLFAPSSRARTEALAQAKQLAQSVGCLYLIERIDAEDAKDRH